MVIRSLFEEDAVHSRQDHGQPHGGNSNFLTNFTSQGARADSPEERFSPTWPKSVEVLIS